ncbi:hypothetical protein MIND_00208200 [Mycena indigotica]|uniref:Uncharacterized protein n=1 Tax=Mycena indigotica TaxID=2126181 RepID=A0A8H6T9S8_9AGAR|nr:uncharacterized protein MIND_00208200 [Mycena indigotica]KAF7311965.1 hypothetical protein MIND_00208200 [Mycena indigotica]
MLPQQIIFTRRSFSSPFLQSIRAAHNSTTLGIPFKLHSRRWLPFVRLAVDGQLLPLPFTSKTRSYRTSWTLRFNAARLAAATCYQQWFTKLRNTTSHLYEAYFNDIFLFERGGVPNDQSGLCVRYDIVGANRKNTVKLPWLWINTQAEMLYWCLTIGRSRPGALH